ncbi:MAG TPA: acetyl-CoA carboxylase biotin carboxyl carrier protein [Bryobacteraceae bacterium]|nr:acetyl-CoA carboxylase biotin carboxyl carrier protein [Bryobacteraceae bacterium]
MSKDSMSNDDIKELIQIVLSTGISELEVQRGENRVRIRAHGAHSEVTVTGSLSGSQTPAPPPAIAPAQPAAPAPAISPDTVLVKSPIVGTFYESASPGTPPFVKVGDAVEPGQVLCIIESMKLMNEIESEIAGTVVSRLMENGRPVEYGEALFAIRPR